MPDATGDSTQIQRELARRTAEKIDQIESEMISAGLPVPPPPKRVQERMAAQAAPVSPALAGQQAADPARDSPATLPPLELHSGVFDGSGHGEGIKINDAHLAPELEEAAILFANGQAGAAAATLRSTLAGGADVAANPLGWMMLFDVYQATAAKAEFEALALNYAARFEQSPPAWRESDGPAAPAAAKRGGLAVAMPATLDEGVQKQLDMAARARIGKRPVTLDLGAVRKVQPVGAKLLLQMIRAYAAEGSPMIVVGAATALEALRGLVQPGNRDVGEDVWMLALELLRVRGEQQQFDDLSIDYCVTFEVSPPSWAPMPDNIREPSGGEPTGDAAAGSSAGGSSGTGPGADAAGAGDAAAGLRGFPMSGELVGRIQKELLDLREYVNGRTKIVVDCRGLGRLDFVAAGELLNEAVTLRAAGKELVFVDVSSIVAALMSVMGIHELADIRKRKI